MFRGLVFALPFLVTPLAGAVQPLGGLHIKVVVVDSQHQATPVPRHALLISDNPASAPPRRIFTSADGTVDVRLPPGNYTVESDRPVAFDGKAYQWTQLVDIVAGREARLELTVENAEVVAVTSAAASATQPLEADPSSLLARWQDSIVAIWTATTHGSGFVIDASGLIATDQQVIGGATSVEVQLSPRVKVAGTVIASDAMRGVALIRIDPSIAASAKALPLECDQPAEPLTKDLEITALEAPLGRPLGTTVGSIDSALLSVINTDLAPSAGGTGGPAFAPTGRLIGLTTLVNERDGQRGSRGRIVRVSRVCELVASVAQKIKGTPLPPATPLPVEAVRPFPSDSAGTAAPGHAGSPTLYRLSTSGFDIVFITPVQLRAAQARSDRTGGDEIAERLLTDFSNWSEYVATLPPVLLIRVTPKLVEGFWTKVARGAASTQGVAIPPIKSLKPDFARLRAFCGDAEITPVHPFKLEHRVSDNDTLVEGLYAFDPGALAPECASIKLELYSEKQPLKAEPLVVDAKMIQQIWQDFAPYRAIR
ncbi:MAG: serine protease [Vicinamibacterales bacterium]